jgi:phosphotriesterase-related protein
VTVATVETLNGPLDADELGRTLIHEHLRFRDEGVVAQWPHLYDEQAEYEAAMADARAIVSHGVKTIADPNAMFGGRDVRFEQRVAQEAGLQVVLATGIYTYAALPHFFDFRDADAMAELFVHDIEQGIQGTDLKAGFLKCACDEPGMNDNVEKVHRAVARASKQTGAPIMAHSRPASGTGPEQMRIFEDEGVDPAKVQIAHTGDTDDLDYIEGLLERGPFIGMDRYGLDMFLPTDKRNATVLELLERGYADRMFLSQDYCSTIDWFPPEVEEQLRPTAAPKWSMTFLLEEVIPELQQGGMTDEQLDQMMVENPKRWLVG